MGEFINGRWIWLPKFSTAYWHGIPHPQVTFYQKYIWKRTYHKLKDKDKFDFDYAYKYLFKN